MITLEERNVLEAARRIKTRERKAQKAKRPPPVVPVAPGQRQPRVHDKPYLAWVRRLPCVSCAVIILGGYMSPSAPRGGSTQAAHLRMSIPGRPNAGMQQKPDDIWCTPLCASCHAEQHAGSEQAFWDELEIDPFDLCRALRAAYEADSDGAEIIRKFSSGETSDV